MVDANKLKLNPNKTEFMVFDSYRRSKLEQFFAVNILGTLVKPADTVKTLGVWFDLEFTLSRNVQAILQEITLAPYQISCNV